MAISRGIARSVARWRRADRLLYVGRYNRIRPGMSRRGVYEAELDVLDAKLERDMAHTDLGCCTPSCAVLLLADLKLLGTSSDTEELELTSTHCRNSGSRSP